MKMETYSYRTKKRPQNRKVLLKMLANTLVQLIQKKSNQIKTNICKREICF